MKKSVRKSPSKIQDVRSGLNLQRGVETIRVTRHQQLIQNVFNFTRTWEQQEKLAKMKLWTDCQIEKKFLQGELNKKYIFPKNCISSSSEDDQEITNYGQSKIQNLYLQNKSLSGFSTLFSTQKRTRVKSLGQPSIGIKSQKLLHKIDKAPAQKSSKARPNLQRSVSVRQLSMRKLILPKLGRNIQIVRTQQGVNKEVQRLMKIKLNTQTNSPVKKSKFDVKIQSILIFIFLSKSNSDQVLGKLAKIPLSFLFLLSQSSDCGFSGMMKKLNFDEYGN